MRNLIVKMSLKYVICLLGITIFITSGTYMSFADKAKNHKDNGLFQEKGDGDNDGGDGKGGGDDGKGGGDDDNGGGDDDGGGDGGGDDGTHNAGKNCLTSGCHASGENKFYIGGTIYTSASGTSPRANATITVVDANGGKTTMSSDNIGNFYSGRSAKAPFSVSAYYQGREVFMPTSASQGGCNASSCHDGISAGRVFISTNDLDLTGTVSESSSGGSSEISYNGDIKSILDAKCISCHQQGGVKSDVPLTTYAEVTNPRLVTAGSADSLLIRKLNKDLIEGTMWIYLNSTSEYNKINDWIVIYNAQEYSSGLDSSGVAIADARVSLRQNGKTKYRATTNSAGEFIISKVKAGDYSLKITKNGYKTYGQSYRMTQTNAVPLDITMNKK